MINVRMQPTEVQKLSPKITVIGVGGAGGNAVNNMISSDLQGVEFLVCNTDAQALEGSYCETKIQLGTDVTGGLGAGAKPEVGRAAAEESLNDVLTYLEGSNMAFITAGMGGGTGTGAAPVIAKACREKGILTVGVVTKPFHFEGTTRMRMAEQGIEEMQDYVDTLIVIPNQNLFRVANEKTTFAEAFRMADSVLQSGVRGVTDLMVMPGLINLDFADIRSSMIEMGKAMMGTGEAEGERRSVEAAEAAINNPLLDDVTMKGARGVIINVTGGTDMTLFEVDEACNRIRDEVDPNANIIFGSTFDEKLDGVMRVSVVATGIDAEERRVGSTGGGAVFTNAVSQQGTSEKKLERAQPNATSMSVAEEAETAQDQIVSAQQPSLSAATYSPEIAKPAAPAPAPEQAELSSFSRGPEMPQPSAETDANASEAKRGTIYNDAFIPPKPVEAPKPFDGPAADMTQTPAVEETVMEEQPAAPETQDTELSASRTQDSSVSPASAGSTLNLKPPVPGGAGHVPTPKKKPASLFERFTSPLRQGHDDRRDEETSGEGRTGSAGGAGGFGSLGLRAPKTAAAAKEQPQGSLNIDMPKEKTKKEGSEDELDIPAFLRRQAN